MVQGGTRDAHQCMGTLGSHCGSEELCQQQEGCGKEPTTIQQRHISTTWETHSSVLYKLESDLSVVLALGKEHFSKGVHFPRVRNVTAGKELRTVRDRCDRMIHSRVFAQINKRWVHQRWTCLSHN